MKTVKFIGVGNEFVNLMTDEGESIIKLSCDSDTFSFRPGKKVCIHVNNIPVAYVDDDVVVCENDMEYTHIPGLGRYVPSDLGHLYIHGHYDDPKFNYWTISRY